MNSFDLIVASTLVFFFMADNWAFLWARLRCSSNGDLSRMTSKLYCNKRMHLFSSCLLSATSYRAPSFAIASLGMVCEVPAVVLSSTK